MISLAELRKAALEVGFDDVGASVARPAEGVEASYRAWVDRGYQGEMSYLERNLEKRLDPTLLVPGARTVVSALLSYNIPLTPEMRRPPRIARYAWLRDYHLIVKEKLFTLLDRLRETHGDINGRAFVDSAPLLDRYWAERAGLGWLGKNTLLINRKLGSFFFIGSLVIDAAVESSEERHPARCGNCQACLEACPTGALIAPGLMDATKCIAYLTIEKKGALTMEEEKSLGEWAFGCDACQEVCPWNKRAATSNLHHEVLLTRSALADFSNGESPLPPDSPLLRANGERLRELLRSHDAG